jgi:hypothetical protein
MEALATTLAQELVEGAVLRMTFPQALVMQAAPGTQVAQATPAMQATPAVPVTLATVERMEAMALPVLPVVERATAAQVAQAERAGRAMPVTRELLRSRATTLPMCCHVAPTPSRLDRAHRPVRL